MDAASGEAELLRAERSGQAEQVLVAHRARFLSWLERRAGSRALAEDVLQAAYARVLERGAPAVGEEGLVAWFTAVLRNAWLDAVRRSGVEAGAARRLAAEAGEEAEAAELHGLVCECVGDAVEELKPEYAQMVREVDLRERPVGEVAREAGITANHASVRLHRARRALGRQLGRLCGACAAHGCLDCSCKGA